MSELKLLHSGKVREMYVVDDQQKFTEATEKNKYAHGTEGRQALGIWKELSLRGQQGNPRGKVYGYASFDEMLAAGYACWEHVGEGLWARFAVLIADLEKDHPDKSGMQYSKRGPAVPLAFVVDVADNATVQQQLLRNPQSLSVIEF